MDDFFETSSKFLGSLPVMMSNLELVWLMPIRSMNNASISRIEMMPTNFFIVYNVDRSDLVFVNQ